MIFELKLTPDQLQRASSEKEALMACLKTGNKAMRQAAGSVVSEVCVIRILKKSVDARKRPDVRINYKVEVKPPQEFYKEDKELSDKVLLFAGGKIDMPLRPVIIGFGPAGMFAGLILSQYGLKPLILERGPSMETRVADVEAHAGGAPVKPDSNIQFGEGGAGTFSDGKLFSGVKSEFKQYIFDTFVRFGAPEDISYESHPHIGTDNLRNVVVNIREEIKRLGGEIRFDTKVTGLVIENGVLRGVRTGDEIIPASDVILAIGHSSRDTFRELLKEGVTMENKPFSVGVRIEHLRTDIDMAQYGLDTFNYRDITSASYKLAVDTDTGLKLYTFCMCPGGTVVAAESSEGHICTNGMSYYGRDLDNSNSALLVPVDPSIYGEGVLAGMEFQELLETAAYEAGGGRAPATTYGALMDDTVPEGFGRIVPSFKPGVKPSDLSSVFPPVILDTIKDGISKMGRKIKGFDDPEAVLTAVEARSSAPVRITRGETLESLNVSGLYPCGEGAGYAGGITSSAIDGIKCANALVSKYASSGI